MRVFEIPTPLFPLLFIYIHRCTLYRQTLPTENLLQVHPFKKEKLTHWIKGKLRLYIITQLDVAGGQKWSCCKSLTVQMYTAKHFRVFHFRGEWIYHINLTFKTRKWLNFWVPKQSAWNWARDTEYVFDVHQLLLLSDIKPKKNPHTNTIAASKLEGLISIFHYTDFSLPVLFLFVSGKVYLQSKPGSSIWLN